MKRVARSLVQAGVLLWRGVDQARRFVVNVVFVTLVMLGIAWFVVERREDIPQAAALVIAPYGDLVEQLHSDPEDALALALAGERRPETLMRTLLEALESARDDERIQVVYLDLGRMGWAGLSKLQTLKGALDELRSNGKKVIAAADYYNQAQYYLAAAADEIYLHPMGLVLLTGYGSYGNYYKEALDRLEVDWNVFRVGEYKSAVEPFIRGDMSPEAREARSRWLEHLWQTYREEVETARRLEPGTIERYVSEFAAGLESHDGDAAALALASGLVDHVAHRDEVRDKLIELVGEDEDSGTFHQVDFYAYLRQAGAATRESDNTIGVVVAKGDIYDGDQLPGSIGGDSTARLIRQAREEESVKALVLRVDSPGGSSFASELIRREVELTRAAGKPVVASMGSVAASGGYWISMSADEIWAAPTTLTGSIGIYAMLPTFQRTLAKLGIRNDGTGTGELAGTLRPDRELPAQAQLSMELLIEQGYRQFIEGVAEGRNKTPEEVDTIARGRVWIGADAHRLGLVDHLGGLEAAIEAAAERAELGDDYRVTYFELERGWTERLLERLISRATGSLGRFGGRLPAAWRRSPWLQEMLHEVTALERFGDPNGLYAYCFCDPD